MVPKPLSYKICPEKNKKKQPNLLSHPFFFNGPVNHQITLVGEKWSVRLLLTKNPPYSFSCPLTVLK